MSPCKTKTLCCDNVTANQIRTADVDIKNIRSAKQNIFGKLCDNHPRLQRHPGCTRVQPDKRQTESSDNQVTR